MPPPTSNHRLPLCLAFCLFLHFKSSFHIGSILFTRKKKRRRKKKALVCSGRDASEMNVLPPLCSYCRNGKSNQSYTVCPSWAAWTYHIVTRPLSLRTPPSCNCLLSFPPVCERTMLLPGKAGNSRAWKAEATKRLCKPYYWVQLCGSS